MDSFVACKHSPEFRQRRTASSPKQHYNGFCLNKLQCLSDLQSVATDPFSGCTSSTHLSYSQDAKKQVSLLFNTFNLILGCNIYLAAQAGLYILSLSPLSDACKTFRKKFVLVCLFKMQTKVPVSVFFCILLCSCFSHKLNNVTCFLPAAFRDINKLVCLLPT